MRPGTEARLFLQKKIIFTGRVKRINHANNVSVIFLFFYFYIRIDPDNTRVALDQPLNMFLVLT